MKTLGSFSPPADGVQAFAINPSIFQAYAIWKKKAKVEVLHREVVLGQGGTGALLVWYRVRPKKRGRSKSSLEEPSVS